MKHTGTYLSLFFLLLFASCQPSEEQEENPNNGGQLQTTKFWLNKLILPHP